MEASYEEHKRFDYNAGDEEWDEGYIRACEEILHHIEFYKLNK